MDFIWFLIGAIFGTIAGVFILSLLIVVKRANDRAKDMLVKDLIKKAKTKEVD